MIREAADATKLYIKTQYDPSALSEEAVKRTAMNSEFAQVAANPVSPKHGYKTALPAIAGFTNIPSSYLIWHSSEKAAHQQHFKAYPEQLLIKVGRTFLLQITSEIGALQAQFKLNEKIMTFCVCGHSHPTLFMKVGFRRQVNGVEIDAKEDVQSPTPDRPPFTGLHDETKLMDAGLEGSSNRNEHVAIVIAENDDEEFDGFNGRSSMNGTTTHSNPAYDGHTMSF